MYEHLNVWMYIRMNRWLNELMSRWMSSLMDEWQEGLPFECLSDLPISPMTVRLTYPYIPYNQNGRITANQHISDRKFGQMRYNFDEGTCSSPTPKKQLLHMLLHDKFVNYTYITPWCRRLPYHVKPRLWKFDIELSY